MANNSGHSHSHEGTPHIVGGKIFLTVLLFLVFMTVLTVVVSRFDLGAWNIVVAMVVASIKALTVALFFMHLKYEDPFTWAYAILPLFILCLLLGGVFIDNPFRIHIEPKAIESSAAQK